MMPPTLEYIARAWRFVTVLPLLGTGRKEAVNGGFMLWTMESFKGRAKAAEGLKEGS